MLKLIESKIWDVVSGQQDQPNNACEQTKLAKDIAKAALIIKSDILDALFLQIENNNNPPTCWNTLKKTSFQTGWNVIYVLLFKAVKYPTNKKTKKLTKKLIINYHLTKITSIIDKLLAVIEKKHSIWDNVKLVLLFKSLLLEFDQQKAYIQVNQNIILREATTFLANNKVLILWKNVIGLEIKATAIIARTKRGKLQSTTASKEKFALTTTTTLLEDIKY